MRNRVDKWSFLLLLGCFLIIPVMAQDTAPNQVESWIVTPKAGHQAKLEAAIKEHMAALSEMDAPQSWQTYQPVTGGNIDTYIFRSCCHSWADRDAFTAWDNKPGNGLEHWMTNVDPHVERYEHHFSSMDFDNSNWPAEQVGSPALVGVTYFNIKPGHTTSFQNSVTMLSDMAKEGGWDSYWSWGTAVSGGNTVYLANPYKNYADMEPPEKSFAEFLMDHMDSEEHAMGMLDNFSSHIASEEYVIYRHRPDLSSPDNG